jgi:hypothetical protein
MQYPPPDRHAGSASGRQPAPGHRGAPPAPPRTSLPPRRCRANRRPQATSWGVDHDDGRLGGGRDARCRSSGHPGSANVDSGTAASGHLPSAARGSGPRACARAECSANPQVAVHNARGDGTPHPVPGKEGRNECPGLGYRHAPPEGAPAEGLPGRGQASTSGLVMEGLGTYDPKRAEAGGRPRH